MELYLPHDVIYRSKSSFGAPLRYWMRHDLRELLGDWSAGRARGAEKAMASIASIAFVASMGADNRCSWVLEKTGKKEAEEIGATGRLTEGTGQKAEGAWLYGS